MELYELPVRRTANGDDENGGTAFINNKIVNKLTN